MMNCEFGRFIFSNEADLELLSGAPRTVRRRAADREVAASARSRV